MNYKSFIFKNYLFNKALKTLELNYSLDNQLFFTEKYIFNFDFANYDEAILDQAFQDLFLMAGISYFKTCVPKNITIENVKLNENQAAFFSKIYQKGLGEFFYINKLDPNSKVNFPITNSVDTTFNLNLGDGFLIGIGGGKDSLVVSEALRNKADRVFSWSLNHRDKLEPLINRIDLSHFYVERVIDSRLLELNKEGALNGHVPISAIISFVGVIVAILSNTKDIVVGNEQTANEPNLVYNGVAINHQYSKSQEYEDDLINYLNLKYQSGIRYYSFLRPLSEMRIAEIFAKSYFNKYKDVFSSCNRAFHLDSSHLFWCGECPKCAFIFLILTPFVDKNELVKLWRGKNLLLTPELQSTYQALLGIQGDKPLDCVGEVKESRAAMRMAQEIYPELKELYQFDLPGDYDYKKVYPDSMPDDIRSIFNEFISQF